MLALRVDGVQIPGRDAERGGRLKYHEVNVVLARLRRGQPSWANAGMGQDPVKIERMRVGP